MGGRGKPVVLSNGREWPTQEEARAHFRALRDRYPYDTPITDPTDHNDLCALLERFDEVYSAGPSKIGCGIAYFVTRVNYTNGGKTIGFWVARTDQSETDFSFIKAITRSPVNLNTEFIDACRDCVHQQVIQSKEAHFAFLAGQTGQLPCEITGELVTKFTGRVDYAPTSFSDIVWAFRVAEGWQDAIPANVVSNPADAQTSTTFVDIDAMVRFRQLHVKNASLRLVAKSATRSQILATRSQTPRRPIRLI
ncbi:DUF3223 domain-containing protein [Tardiphaga sp. 862_B3_N4_1]|uniref:DUF3223 domain-containing protein n=1 Tax=Tardiphaga sp. 862_B3_N4_1 TaxID=3240764 RepID=UPI003F24A4C7